MSSRITVIVNNPAPIAVTVDPRATGVPGAAGATGPQGPQGPAGQQGPQGTSAAPVLLRTNAEGPPNEFPGQAQSEQITVTASGAISGSYAIYVTRNGISQQLIIASLGNSAVTAAAAIRARLELWAATPAGSGAVISGADTTIYLTLPPAANDPTLNISLPGSNGIVGTPNSTNLNQGIAPRAGAEAVAIGQLCRFGNGPLYTWHVANTAGTGPEVWTALQSAF